MLLTAFPILWGGNAIAQTKVEFGDTITEAGWFLTDAQLVELTERMENLVKDSTLLRERVRIADNLYALAASRVAACQDMLTSTDSLLNQAIKVSERSFWEKVPDVVWLGLGVFVGTR